MSILKIRLQRFGQKKQPLYHIVCMKTRSKTRGKPIEKLGTYDPIPKNGNKDILLDFERTKYWLGVGAQPSDTAARLLEMANLYIRKPRPYFNPVKVPTKSDHQEAAESTSYDANINTLSGELQKTKIDGASKQETTKEA